MPADPIYAKSPTCDRTPGLLALNIHDDMGVEGLEPTRLHQSTDFHLPTAFAATRNPSLEDWTLPLPSTLR